MIDLIHGDCLEIMPNIQDNSIDMILCDLPYGTTNNKWDSIIDLDRLWAQYERIIKHNGAIVLFAQTPFDKILGASNLKLLKYEFIWNKKRPTGHLNSKFAPMKLHENILVFSKGSAAFVRNRQNSMIFNPQFTKGNPYIQKKGDNKSTNYGSQVPHTTINDGNNYYPTSILEFKTETGLHPTQKPVALFEYLIKTYTNEGDVVLDNCAGSFTTAIACDNLNRKSICIEKEFDYFNIGLKRLENNRISKGLFQNI